MRSALTMIDEMNVGYNFESVTTVFRLISYPGH